MTREEAIAIIERLAHTEAKWPGTEDTLEALDMAHADHGSRLVRRDGEFPTVEETATSWADHRGRAAEYVAGEWWPAEPNVRRVVNGVPNRVDRLKCLGNAVVPQQFYPIFQAIADIERGIVHG